MKKKTGIKICGLTLEAEADYINENNIDYAGFVFYEKSRRNVSTEKAKAIMAGLDDKVRRVAVTVSPDTELMKRIEEAGFDIIQIHGELTDKVLETVKIPVWRAINIADMDEQYEKLRFYENINEELQKKIRGVLMDAPDFGSGKTFNWRKTKRLLKAGDRSSPFGERDFILAGGLNSSNVSEGIRIFEPDIVDVSSGIEGENGKSEEKIREFVNAVRKGEHNE